MSFLNEIWLGIRTDKADGLGNGTPGDPYAVNTPESFGTIMFNEFGQTPANRLVRLGPGIFYTRGGGGNGVAPAPFVPQGKLWRARPGQKIVGADIFATTLRFLWDLAPTGHPGQRHNMVWGQQTGNPLEDFLSSFELSDLTLDLGLNRMDIAPFEQNPQTIEPTQGRYVMLSGSTVSVVGDPFFTESMEKKIIYIYDPQDPVFAFFASIDNVDSEGPWQSATLDRSGPSIPAPGLPFWVFGVRFTVTALSVVGDNTRIRRVRVINFGTRTPFLFDGLTTYPGPNRTYEGFPIVAGGRIATKASFNAVMEDCVFEQPFPGPGREVTCAVMAGGVHPNATGASPAEALHLQPMGCVIRNCYFNFEYINPRPGNRVKVSSSSYDSGKVTVTTEFP